MDTYFYSTLRSERFGLGYGPIDLASCGHAQFAQNSILVRF